MTLTSLHHTLLSTPSSCFILASQSRISLKSLARARDTCAPPRHCICIYTRWRTPTPPARTAPRVDSVYSRAASCCCCCLVPRALSLSRRRHAGQLLVIAARATHKKKLQPIDAAQMMNKTVHSVCVYSVYSRPEEWRTKREHFASRNARGVRLQASIGYTDDDARGARFLSFAARASDGDVTERRELCVYVCLSRFTLLSPRER